MTTKSPFVSNPERGIYFWSHSEGGRHFTFSNKPHELLPFACAVHRWFSDVACRACDAAVPVVHRGPLPRAQMELSWS